MLLEAAITEHFKSKSGSYFFEGLQKQEGDAINV